MSDNETAPRARVDLVLGWRAVGGNGRIYRKRADAYYELAKKLVLAKYPAGLTDYNGPSEYDRAYLGEALDVRAAKAMALFCWPLGSAYEGAFDSDRFKRFVKRVARFLMVVDDRTHRSHLHEQYECAIQSAAKGAEAYRYRKDDPR